MRFSSCGSIAIVLLLAATLSVEAQKPKVKPRPPSLGAIGTSQMPGAQCDIGKAYTLGKSGPFNVCLVSVEYRATRIPTFGTESTWPEAGKKLLVLHYTVHNPLPKEQRFDGAILWTAVTADSQNAEAYDAYLEPQAGKQPTSANQVLKPAQKIAVYSVLTVPAAGEIPKLIAAHRFEKSALVARYNIAGKGKKIAPPYVDRADASGATPLEKVQGAIGQAYEVGDWDVTVQKLEIGPAQIDWIDSVPVGETQAYLAVTFTATNRNYEGFQKNGIEAFLNGTIVDADGGTYEMSNGHFRTSSFAHFDQTVEWGATVTFRKVFTVAKGVALNALRLQEGSSRQLIIDLGGFIAK